jgi:hypothetical protein
METDAEWYRNLDNWHGSYLEVSIELDSLDDQRLQDAFAAAWSSTYLAGPLEPPRLGVPLWLPGEPLGDDDAYVWTYGTLALPGVEDRVGCEIHAIRDPECDWLNVSIPTGMLDRAYPVKYPLLSAANPWIAEVKRRLAVIADGVNASVPFDLAIVGEEVSGSLTTHGSDPRSAIDRATVERSGGVLLSPTLWARLDLTSDAELLPSGLRWVRPVM